MAPKTPVSVSVDPRLAKQAGDLKVDLSKAAEDGLTRAVQAERERLWRLENAVAIEAANDFVDENGLPFDRHRQF